MKIILTFVLLALSAVFAQAQTDSVEADFVKNKPRLTVERFGVGEDASSGYDYLVYRSKAGIVLLRSIWSSTANSEAPQVEDYYFQKGRLVLYVKSKLARKLLKSAARGAQVALKTEEKLFLKDGKLMAWLENGKPVSTEDARWQEREKSVFEAAKNEIEMYKMNKEAN